MSKNILGIDFGTTNSAVASVMGNEVVIIPNNYGRLTPSIVSFTEEGETLIGFSAKNYAALNPKNTIKSVKRYMGTDKVFKIGDKNYTSCEIASMIIKKMVTDAEEYLGESVDEAIITVPAYYNDIQRSMTIKSGQLAGINVERIITEPTAAALAYGFTRTQGEESKILVYDLGGGTFDVTVLKLSQGFFKVLATNGDSRLGGDDFDNVLVEYIVKRFHKENGIDLTLSPLAMQKILETSEKVKIELSDRKSTDILIPFIIADANGPKNINYKITREEFENMIKGIVSRTIPLVFDTITASRCEKEDIDKIILVGGSTKIPFIQKLIEFNIGKSAYKNINPDECVALGAAIAGGIKSQQIKKSIIRDVLPQPLGTDIDDDVMDIVLDKNTPIPARHSKIYTTTEDYQTEIGISVYQGTSRNASENQLLGEYLFKGIEPKPRKVPSIEIEFKIDVNGILNVSAKDLDSGKAMDWTIKRGFENSNVINKTITFNEESNISLNNSYHMLIENDSSNKMIQNSRKKITGTQTSLDIIK